MPHDEKLSCNILLISFPLEALEALECNEYHNQLRHNAIL